MDATQYTGGFAGDQQVSGDGGRCSSNTYPQCSQSPASLSFSAVSDSSSVHIDEFSCGLVIAWDDSKLEHWAAIERARKQAQEQKFPCVFPLIPGAIEATVDGHGSGRGRDSHLAYTIKCGPAGGVVVQVDRRQSHDRSLYNGRIRITGTACLLMGYWQAWELACKVVKWLGGTVKDDWVKTLHVCCDLPGVGVDEFAEPFKRRQFVTTAKKWHFHDGVSGVTGFTVGQSSGRVRLNVYDKLEDIRVNHDETYERAYIDRRCKGEKPECATRVEYQIGREWFREFEIDRVADVLGKLPEIVQKVTATGDDESYAFFRLTDVVPDRDNKHQSRAGVFRLWSAVTDAFRLGVGQPEGRLARIKRDSISCERAVKTVVSYLAGMGARWCRYVETVDDLCDVLRRGIHTAGVELSEIAERWERHARKAGTLQFVTGFDAQKLDPTGRLRREAETLFDVAGESCYVPF